MQQRCILDVQARLSLDPRRKCCFHERKLCLRVQSLALLTRDNVETLLVQLMPLYGLSLGVSNCMGTARNID